MNIDRKKVTDEFFRYLSQFDIQDERIKTKIEHTKRVAELSEKIAYSLNLPNEDIQLAWLIGMLHDIGRFEQARSYGTFEDAISVNHALLGHDILFGQRLIEKFVESCKEDKEYQIIEKAVLHHSDYRLPDDLTTDEKMYADILRDADKIDILKVVTETEPVIIYGATYDELAAELVSEDVLKCFYEHRAVLRSDRKTHIDNIVGYASFIFELVYPRSKTIALEQGYIWEILSFKSQKSEVNVRLEKMAKELKNYLMDAR